MNIDTVDFLMLFFQQLTHLNFIPTGNKPGGQAYIEDFNFITAPFLT